jgi:auxin responsive GH3 family protein
VFVSLAAVEETLKPNPDLASVIERECSQEDWEGIFPPVSSQTRTMWDAMLQYAPALQHFAGHLPILSPAYGASECGLIGINPNMKCATEDITYLMWPEKAYYS